MESAVLTIAIALISALSGAGVLSFIQFLIQRKDNTQKKLDSLLAKSTETELALCRLQLLNLIQHNGSQHETMMVAERYFKELDGDWYMTPIFCRWLTEHDLAKPVWFNGKD